MKLFITSSGTGIGKTLVTTSLCWQLRQSGKTVKALKPVISGYDAADLNNDSALILKSSDVEPTAPAQEAISPWRYKAPLAPAMAAAKEGHPIDIKTLTDFCLQPFSPPADVILAEGVGGIMVPLNQHQTVLDWVSALSWPVVLVAGSYLGSISHALTALQSLRSRDLAVRAIIVSASEDGVPLEDTAATLEKFLI